MKVLKVLGWLIVPYITIFFQWKKINKPGKAFGVIWSLFALLTTIGAMSGNSNNNSTTTSAAVTSSSDKTSSSNTSQKNTQTNASTPTSTKPAAKPAPSWSEVTVSNSTVSNQLHVFAHSMSLLEDSGFPKDITKIDVSDDSATPGKKHVDVYYKPDSIWDETTFVKSSIGTDLDVMKLLFSNKNIASVSMYTQADMTDQYGKKTTETGMRLDYDRPIIDKISWDGFESRVLTSPADALAISSSYEIHLGIFKNVKIDGLTTAIGGTGE